MTTTPITRALRDLVSQRASTAEAFRVAEFQARKVLELSGITEESFDERLIMQRARSATAVTQ